METIYIALNSLATLHWDAIFKIVVLDIMLGGDNAILIALACASLTLAMRGKAILLGTAGAIVLRAMLLGFAGVLMDLPYLKLVAGLYLLYIGYSLLVSAEEPAHVDSPDKLWQAIKVIIVADFMMSLDNVLSVTAAAQSAGEHSTAYAIAGILFSIPVIIIGSTLIAKMMDKYPVIVWLGGGLLGWVGGELIVHEFPHWFEHYSLWIQTLGAAIVVGAAAIKTAYDSQNPAQD